MSYYILPKNVNTINVHPKSSTEACNPIISYSFLYYYEKMQQQFDEMIHGNEYLQPQDAQVEVDNIMKIMNPYEFIFSTVPGSKYAVSKLKPKSNLYYDLFEMHQTLNCLDRSKKSMKSLHISKNHIDSIECFEMIREGFDDEIVWKNEINIDDFADLDKKFDFMFFEEDISSQESYFQFIVKVMCYILKHQSYNGVVILKVGDIFHKPVLDFVYYLTSLYERVYIAKPYTNNVLSNEKYVVCKYFKYDMVNFYLKLNYLKLIIFLKKLENCHITEMLDIDVPYFFKNKIEELNIILGQTQLETMDNVISLFKNKNKGDKI